MDWLRCCAYLCKDTNLKAIHNAGGCLGCRWWLCLPMQRYKFESNSQPVVKYDSSAFSCAYLCKDTNLKAIHNENANNVNSSLVVLTYAKIQIWKQFTTVTLNHCIRITLCLPMQRYKFESNSQLMSWLHLQTSGCAYLCKDTNLKAIHNSCSASPRLPSVVLTYAKIQIWKQFTTHNSQAPRPTKLCLPMQRYKFESNSQRASAKDAVPNRCAYLCKDTNLKAIHNETFEVFPSSKLCLPMQRYKFESNSQHIKYRFTSKWGCAYLCKDTNLKAIHNSDCNIEELDFVVLTYAKIQIWKQFTT